MVTSTEKKAEREREKQRAVDEGICMEKREQTGSAPGVTAR